MREILGWCGLAVVLGTASWALWRPEGPLLHGVIALALLSLLSRRAGTSALALLSASFLLGAAVPARQPAPPAPGAWSVVAGEVVATSGWRARLRTADGTWSLRFGEAAPPRGTRLAAWVQPSRRESLLPGEPDRSAALRLGGQRPARVRRWVRLGGPAPPVAPGPWSLAEHGGLLRALATGDRAGVSEEEERLLRRTGTRHLLAISGLHLGLLAGGAAWLARALGRVLLSGRWPGLVGPLAGLVAVGACLAFAERVGWPVSARRASVMVCAAAALLVLGRRPRAWSVLGLAAGGVALVDPAQVLGASFHLSFGAVAGILAVVPRLERWLPPDLPWLLRAVLGSLLASAGATLGTLPATALWFQELAPWGLVANAFAIPLVAGVGVPAALSAAALPGAAGRLALALGDAALGLTLEGLALLPAELWHPAVGPLGAAGLALCLCLRRQELSGLCAVGLLLGLRVVPSTLELTVLDVGQGDAALVRGPGGGAWLVDGGPDREAVLRWLRREGLRELDAVVLSHPHADHLGGLEAVLRELEVAELWVPRPPRAGEARYLALWQAAFARGVVVRTPEELRWRVAPSGLAWQALHPLDGWRARGRDAVNEESLVLVARLGRRSVLFAGDIEEDAEAALRGRLPRVDLLKVAHHGSRSSSSWAWLAEVRPWMGIVSAGRNNRFGHPSPDVLARWAGRRLIRTDRLGTVRLRLEGRAWRARRSGPLGTWRYLTGSPWRPRSPGPDPPAPAGLASRR